MGLFGLFGKPKDDRKEIKAQISKLMKQYDKEQIDGPTYSKKMIDLVLSHQKKKK